MGLFDKLFSKPAPAPTLPPNWLAVDGEWVDLNTLGPARLAALEVYLQSQRQAREAQLLEFLRGLAAERERLLAAADPALWLLTLKLMFGEVLGRRVAAQDIVPGMELRHVVMGFGPPDRVDANGPRVLLFYGPDSVVELDGERVSRTAIGQRPALPAGFAPAGPG